MFGGGGSGNSSATGLSRKTQLNSGRLFHPDSYTLPGQSGQLVNGSASGSGGVGVIGSQRKGRLLFSASPYHSAASARIMNRKGAAASGNASLTGNGSRLPSSTLATASNTPSPSSCSSSSSSLATVGLNQPNADGLSSTARLILDTLDRMNTPLRDAQKMLPYDDVSAEFSHHSKLETPSRAEKRKLIAEKLNLSSATFGGSEAGSPAAGGSAAKRARRRPHLGGQQQNLMETSVLRGPPTRSTAFMTPVAARTKARKQPQPPILPPSSNNTSRSKSSPVLKASPSSTVVSMKPNTDTVTPTGFFTAPSSVEQKIQPFAGGFSTGGISGPIGGGGGGGKMKAKSSLGEIRAQRSSPAASGRDQSMASSFLPSSLTSSSASSSTLTMSSMPSINFGKTGIPSSPLSSSNQQTVIAQQWSGNKPTMTSAASSVSDQFKFCEPEKISVSSSPNLLSSSASGPTFMFSSPDKVGGANSTRGQISSAAGSPERMHGVLPDFLTHAGNGRNGAGQQETSRTNNYNKMPVMKMPSTQAMTPKPLLKAGSVMDVLGPRGNRGKLPDVTSTGKSALFEGGIKPATELKNASVMSILGGMTSATSSSNKEPSWDLKFKSSSQPWQ